MRIHSEFFNEYNIFIVHLVFPLSYPNFITSYFVSSNPAHGEAYSIHHYVIKFVSNLRQVSDFAPGPPVSPTNKTDRHNITKILLKVTWNTITS